MWLPSTVYNKAPHYWLLLGILFMVVGGYLGFQENWTYLMAGVALGVACCAWSALVFSKRSGGSRQGESSALSATTGDVEK